jgi:hypothetical protein
VSYLDFVIDAIVLTCLLTFFATALAAVLDLFNSTRFKLRPATRKMLHKLMLAQIVVASVGAFTQFLIPQRLSTTLKAEEINPRKEINALPDAAIRLNPGEEALGLPTVSTFEAQHRTIPAAPVLHEAGISLRDISPPTSNVVIKNNIAIYGGQAINPKLSQNVLMQETGGDDPGSVNVPASFTLVFDKPVTSVSFVRPALFPETESGVTHPAWSAHALDAEGHELSSYSESLLRKLKPHNVPSLIVTLTAPAFEDISSVRFDSDYRLNGKPFAGFFSVVLERLTWTRQKESSGQN